MADIHAFETESVRLTWYRKTVCVECVVRAKECEEGLAWGEKRATSKSQTCEETKRMLLLYGEEGEEKAFHHLFDRATEGAKQLISISAPWSVAPTPSPRIP